jgi:dienelactone hydrolase
MNLQRVTDLFAPEGHSIPGLLLTPDAPRGGVVLVPPYGTAKESMLAVAIAIAEKGLAALSIDICGHGENYAPIGPGMLGEVNAAVAYVSRFGRTAASGVSIGGRLALMSSADCMVAISPSVITQMSPQGKWMFENLPSPGVREPYSGYVIELLQKLGPVPAHDRPCLLLYAERDIPAILEGAASLKQTLKAAELQYVKHDLRPDLQHDVPFIRYLPRWFNHLELKFNPEVLQVTSGWLAAHQAIGKGA